MSETSELYDSVMKDFLTNVQDHDLSTDEATTAMKNLELFSKVRPPEPEVTETPIPEPTTFWGKAKVTTARVWDNETTRVLIKAGGAFAGVGLVVWSTVHRDHVLDRQAMSQATQRNS